MSIISVAIATHNEQENIGSCLASVSNWVNEIVVVDGESTDKTIEIAQKYKVKILKGKHEKMFHVNKQKAVDACKSDWILQLDADEVVTEKLKKEILEVTGYESRVTDEKIINGYWIPRENFFLGKFLEKGGQYPDYTLRLYRHGKGRLPCKNVHEQAVVDGQTKFLKNPLKHFPYPNFSHYLEHFNLYTDILAGEMKNQKVPLTFYSAINYLVIKPKLWFLKTYLRHKGFMDGIAGFAFSIFSSLRFLVAYIKYWESTTRKQIKK